MNSEEWGGVGGEIGGGRVFFDLFCALVCANFSTFAGWNKGGGECCVVGAWLLRGGGGAGVRGCGEIMV